MGDKRKDLSMIWELEYVRSKDWSVVDVEGSLAFSRSGTYLMLSNYVVCL